MRLINTSRLHQIIQLGLSEPVFRESKKLLAIGEKLKETEQSLLFLRRCKQEQIFPVFILQNIRAPDCVFPVKFSSFHQKKLRELRLSCLNQHIQFKYTLINELKQDSSNIKQFLRDSAPENYDHIIRIYFSNNEETKTNSKNRLLNKFNWLLYKYFLPCWKNGESYHRNFSYINLYHQFQNGLVTLDSSSSQPPSPNPPASSPSSSPSPPPSTDPPDPESNTPPCLPPQNPPVSLPLARPREKVTFVNIPENSVNEATVDLLSLGPGFAVSPPTDQKGKEALLRAIQNNIAAMAINLRWKELLSNTYSAKTLKQHIKGIAPFEQTYTRAPPPADAVIENKLSNLRRDLLNITKSTSVPSNLTPQQRSALKDLRRNDELHVSVADKTAEFVVMPKEDMIRTTTTHFSNTSVYKKLTIPQDSDSAQKFINKLTNTLQSEVNSTIRRIANQRNIPQDAIDLLMSHHTNLPTARVMLKTHKYTLEQIRNLDPDTMKTRPIVSGCNSPFHKALWFVCHILSPLMNQVPTHLKNTYDFLERMRSLPPNTLKNLTFFTADVEALYTNINVHTAIEDVLEFAKENRRAIKTYGLKLRDLQELLETTLGKSYFVYNKQVYLQLLGLFMGTNPAPILATVKMWKLERSAIYVDLRITLPTYSRFYDDLNGATSNSRRAQQLCTLIEQQDADKLIKLTLDYPSSRDQFTPFLNTEVRISNEGEIQSRLFRKPQKKPLTLHYNSHHTTRTKIATVESMYQTAEVVSSDLSNQQYSTKMVDNLLLNNGYSNRVIQKIKEKKKRRKKRSKPPIHDNTAILKLPYLNETTSRKFRDAVKHSGLPIKIVEKPGRRLKDLLTDSRPLDKAKCTGRNCRTCTALDNGDCTARNTIYKITCEMDNCSEIYGGETYRPLSCRFDEHYRSAANPTAKSYIDKPLAKHYREKHSNHSGPPKLKLEIIDKGNSLIDRKIKEARFLVQNKPSLNDKSELNNLTQFLVE